MLKVLIYDERLKACIDEYMSFWRPFLDSGEFALCRWKPDETTVLTAMPELYEVVGDATEWRAVVLYDCRSEALKNPFDFFKGNEPADVVEQQPVIRLTHMLSTVPHVVMPTPYLSDDMASILSDEDEESVSDVPAGSEVTEAGEKAGIGAAGDSEPAASAEQTAGDDGKAKPAPSAEADASGEEASGRSDPADSDYLHDNVAFSFEQKDKDYYRLGESNYQLDCARPRSLTLVATRLKYTGQASGSRPIRLPARRETNLLSDFADRNDYPANVRFVVFETETNKGRLTRQAAFELIHAVMILLLNEKFGTELRSEKLHRIEIEIDKDELVAQTGVFVARLSRIETQINLAENYIREDRKNSRVKGTLPNFQMVYPVPFPEESRDLLLTEEEYSLFKDVPRLDTEVFKDQKRAVSRALEILKREPLRLLRGCIASLRERSEEELEGITGTFSDDQLEDAREEAEEMERELFRSSVAEDVVYSLEEKKEVERDVEDFMAERTTARTAFLGLLGAWGLFLVGFVMFFFQSFGDLAAWLEMLIMIGVGAGALLLTWLVVLILDRRDFSGIFGMYRLSVRDVEQAYRRNQDSYQEYVTRALNYRKYWRFMRTLTQNGNGRQMEEEHIAAEIMLERHKQRLKESEYLCEQIRTAADIRLEVPEDYSEDQQFDFTEEPAATGYYEFPPVAERPSEDDEFMSSELYMGYDYIRRFRLIQETVE